ncbi:MAG: hypothetical protein ACI8RZ_001554 [Myxococcota bacterium]|jgi:hypothetical protein
MLAAAALLLSHSAEAKRVKVPIDIGIGPAFHMMTGPVADDQRWHYGVVLSVEAVLDKKTLKRLRKKIPREYRSAIKQMDEVRVSPSILIPDTIIFSPKTDNTSVYGIGFQPLRVNAPLIKDPFAFKAFGALRATYFYLESDSLPGSSGAVEMHFLRPAVDVGVELEIPLSDRVLISGSWTSQVHIPQPVGGGVGELGDLESSVWHIGQASGKLHYRFPYKVNL